ncbi:MAG TPA: hypothetical protein VF519_11025 [Mycobacteriales bacterium]
MKKYKLDVGLRVVGEAGSDFNAFLDLLMKNLLRRESLLDAALSVDLTHTGRKNRPYAVVDLSIVLEASSPFPASKIGFVNLRAAIIASGGTPSGWDDSLFDPADIEELKERTPALTHPRATVENFAVHSVAA